MRLFRLLPLAFILASTVPACSSGDDDDDSSGTPNTAGTEKPGSTSAEITAADGGEVELGAAKLAIPAGALAEDTTVTVESTKPSSALPDTGSLQGLLYDFGPDGTTFEKAVSLTLPLPAKPGTGKEAVISWLDENTNTWEDLTTTGESGSVSASITHFTKFIVRIRNVNVDQGNVDCSTFTACGGDPTGSWQVASACLASESNESPFGDDCPDAALGIDIAADGTLEVGDGRYTWNLSISGDAVITIPADCIETLGMGGITDCSQFNHTDDDGTETTCTGTVAKGCSCTTPLDPTTENSTGSYTVSGTQIIGKSDDETEQGDPSDFCVKGKTLKLETHDTDDDGNVTSQVLAFTR